MAAFEDESLEAALDRSLRNAKHLRAVHAGTVKAARMLARKIDAWETIVAWALDEANQECKRPSVPQNDNVSIASFLKYMDALGLTPELEAPAKKQTTKPADKPASPVDAMRKGLRAVS